MNATQNIWDRIDAAAESDDAARELLALAEVVANESGLGQDYHRVLDALDTIRTDWRI